MEQDPSEMQQDPSQLGPSRDIHESAEKMSAAQQRRAETSEERGTKKHGGEKWTHERRVRSKAHTEQHEATIDYFNQFVGRNTHCVLGRTGVKVSRVCLGTMNFGPVDKKMGERPGQLDESEAHKILTRYIELGGNCIDTANFFPWFGENCGETEHIIGNWLKNIQREQLFLITKCRLPVDPANINSGGLSRNNIFDSVLHSLRRLKTSYIDLFLLDGWDDTVNVYETVRHMDDLVKSGKVRYFGVSDLKGWQLQKFLDVSRQLNLHRAVCYEGEYNLLTRGCDWEVAEVCKNEKIGFLGYSPLKYGLITDKYVEQADRPVEGSRIEAASRKSPNLAAMAVPFDEIKHNPRFKQLMSTCQDIAKRRNLTVSQVAILWAMQRKFVTSVVVSVGSVDELEECMQMQNDDTWLTYDEMCELNDATSLRAVYPYNVNITQLAGYKFISPDIARSFEQLSLAELTEQDVEAREPQQLHATTTWPTKETLAGEKETQEGMQKQQFVSGKQAQQQVQRDVEEQRRCEQERCEKQARS
jgi:aryl-alcohol dehydrogenase-like predicted oxidoreductase